MSLIGFAEADVCLDPPKHEPSSNPFSLPRVCVCRRDIPEGIVWSDSAFVNISTHISLFLVADSLL